MNAVAVAGHIVRGIIAGARVGTIRRRQQTRSLAVGGGDNRIGHFKLFVRLVSQVVCHDFLPGDSRQTAVRNGRGLIITHPAGQGTVRRCADKPDIVGVVGGTGLTDDIPAGYLRVLRSRVGRGQYVISQQTVHLIRCFGLVGLDRRIVAVVEDNVAVCVGDIVVGVGVIVQAVVADITHGGGHLAYGYAAFHTADRQGAQIH